MLGPEAKVIGVITLNQMLYEIADYRTSALKSTERKLSLRSDNAEV